MSRIYPEIEATSNKSTRRHSNLESNCNQVFMLGPSLTKGLFDKVTAEVSAQQSNLCGFQFKTKHVWGKLN